MDIDMHSFNLVQMLHAGVVAAVVSLGDQSFYVTLIFGTWCPFQGVRSAWGATCQRLLVWIGVVTAFTGRAFMIFKKDELYAKGLPKMELVDMTSGFSASVLLIIMAMRAMTNLGTVSRKRKDTEDEENGNDEMTPLEPGDERMKKRYAFAALVTSLVTAFVVFPGGQVDRFVLKGDKPKLDLILGSIAGYATATFVALIIGSILERSVPVKRLLFANAMGLGCLCLWIGSSTFMFYHKTYLAPTWRKAEDEAAKQAASLMQSSLSASLGPRLMRLRTTPEN